MNGYTRFLFHWTASQQDLASFYSVLGWEFFVSWKAFSFGYTFSCRYLYYTPSYVGYGAVLVGKYFAQLSVYFSTWQFLQISRLFRMQAFARLIVGLSLAD
jgi:hypothetical protein